MNLGDAAPVEDFIGPLIVANVPGKGRGVLVQRDVHRGGGVIRIMLNIWRRFAILLSMLSWESGILDDFCKVFLTICFF